MRRNSALPQHLIRTRETTILRTQCASYSRRHITPNRPAVNPHSSAIRPPPHKPHPIKGRKQIEIPDAPD